jgi:hypothetical protein
LVVTTTTPSDRQAEVAFISGATADATVAATSFGAWTAFEPYPSIPAQYNPYYANVTKWGDIVVTYQLYNELAWTKDEKDALVAAMALWSAEVAITFTPTAGETPDLTFYQQPLPGGVYPTTGSFQAFSLGTLSQIGSNVASVPGQTAFITFDIKSETRPDGHLDAVAESNFFYYTAAHEIGHARARAWRTLQSRRRKTFRRCRPTVRTLRHGVVDDDVLHRAVGDERDVLCRLSGDRDQLGQRGRRV